MMIVTATELNGVIKKILMAAGADERNADRVAEALVSANLCGVDTHGVYHLPGYLAMIETGEIVPTAWPEILAESSTTALIGGNWTFGHVTAKYATEVAIKKALQENVAVVSMVQVNHIGRLGEYAEMATFTGMTSMIFVGSLSEKANAAVPYGGHTRLLHTNPIAMGFPGGDEPPMILDFSTTALSGVKVNNARENKERLRPGCIVDRAGNPTTDPVAFFEGGGHLPFGGHKGYALMLAVEFLGRIFSTADTFAAERPREALFRHSGATLVVFRSDLFQSLTEYRRRADEMERRIRAVPPAPGFKEVLVPGDPEVRARIVRKRDGIPIPDELWQKLTALATSLNLVEGLA
jgi:LDH2 family malate/lactate/ureidoglycolate dehydrogenase